VPIADRADHGAKQAPGNHPPGVVRDALKGRETRGRLEHLTLALQRVDDLAQRGHRGPGVEATSVTRVPAAALVPAAGVIPATRPHPRIRAWKPS
jgi:hypothetical protein